ncbi:hypothetical protein RND81_01G116500 [Saponaria officinalis]|uniref:Secreted protein n=1 Tax=Saponaria officinalis TaxID=3572 RepID=A0AAW1NGB1_SAPOF
MIVVATLHRSIEFALCCTLSPFSTDRLSTTSPSTVRKSSYFSRIGIQCWTQSQIQFVLSVTLLIASATRSFSVDQVETIVIAILHRSFEFALCCWEKLKLCGDDLSLQVSVIQF